MKSQLLIFISICFYWSTIIGINLADEIKYLAKQDIVTCSQFNKLVNNKDNYYSVDSTQSNLVSDIFKNSYENSHIGKVIIVSLPDPNDDSKKVFYQIINQKTLSNDQHSYLFQCTHGQFQVNGFNDHSQTLIFGISTLDIYTTKKVQDIGHLTLNKVLVSSQIQSTQLLLDTQDNTELVTYLQHPNSVWLYRGHWFYIKAEVNRLYDNPSAVHNVPGDHKVTPMLYLYNEETKQWQNTEYAMIVKEDSKITFTPISLHTDNNLLLKIDLIHPYEKKGEKLVNDNFVDIPQIKTCSQFRHLPEHYIFTTSVHYINSLFPVTLNFAIDKENNIYVKNNYDHDWVNYGKSHLAHIRGIECSYDVNSQLYYLQFKVDNVLGIFYLKDLQIKVDYNDLGNSLEDSNTAHHEARKQLGQVRSKETYKANIEMQDMPTKKHLQSDLPQ